ncbi:hypothetical protein ACJMK2_027696 [Sinanodonta woodiana]|uniref:G-protein coupled receptors family 1 profile domain-containing protein n=1 Tax=Sinanodonta woodiana TaxID=1069815 RepID=A0ABD3X500_SINWO
MEATSYASVMTITAFTVERYIAIRHPLKAHKIAKFSRCIRTIIAIWIIAFLCALPYAINTELFFYLHDKNGLPIAESLTCNIPNKLEDRMGFVFQLSTYVFFVLPMTVILVLYILIGLALRKAEEERIASDESNHGHDSSSSHAQRKVVLKLLGVLYFVGSTVNPILYNVMSKRYQQAFKETILRCRGSRRSNSKHGSYMFSQKGDSAIEGQNSSCRKNHSSDKNDSRGTVLRNGATRQVKKVYFSRNVSGTHKRSYNLGSNAKIAHPKLCRIVHKNTKHIPGVHSEVIQSDVTGSALMIDGKGCNKSVDFDFV